MSKLITFIFWLKVALFIFIVAEFFIPAVRDLFRGSLVFLLPITVFFILGLALILAVLKEELIGKLRKFLLLTGLASVGFLIAILLHNFIYALFKAEEPFFFLVAIFVCPIAFLIGALGSIVLFIKKGR